MRPLDSDTARHLIPSNDPILLLNTSMIATFYMSQHIARGTTNITSKNGISLPTELWLQIFELVSATTADAFCFVQATIISRPSAATVLLCNRVEVDFGYDFGYIYDADMVVRVEEYMESPTRASHDDLSLITISGPKSTFQVRIDNHPGQFACLYWGVSVPDVISRLEDGECSACQGRRSICPGCGGTGGSFGVFMGCGVDLACPLCMGLEFSERHKRFLQKYYWDDPPAEEETEWREELLEQLEEFGYPASSCPGTRHVWR